MKNKPTPKKKASNKRKTILWAGAIIVLAFCAAPFIKKASKPRPINKGVITRMWKDPAHHDVRLQSPGVWEEADLPDRWMMEIQDVNTQKFREIEVDSSMFSIYKPSDFIVLGDSATFAKEYAKALKEQAEIDSLKKVSNPIYYSKGIKK